MPAGVSYAHEPPPFLQMRIAGSREMIAPMAKLNDCVPCHFDWEEEHALPHLPFWGKIWLLGEHRRIRAAGYPAADVIAHAEEEMALFREHCPRWIVERIELEHHKFHPVLEVRARTGQSAA